MGKRRGNQADSEFVQISDEEIIRLAHDRSIGKFLRRRYQREEKVRKRRNRQKEDVTQRYDK